MTNEELFTDLKQFITTTISQELVVVATKEDLTGLRTELKEDVASVKADIKRLDDKVDQVQDAIAETLTHVTEAFDTSEQVQDHEQRLRRLEHRSA
ncbi:MAG TPA: hypothetical protein VFU43_04125 [Streptosporangiaceae bacterium]|nr:hypothetical protein [Streptosporangiaceae bacterium]